MIKKSTTQKAFTLVEVVIYISILSIILVATVGFTSNIITLTSRVNSSAELTYNGQLVLNELRRAVHNAEDIAGTDQIPEGTMTFTATGDSWIYEATSSADHGTDSYLDIRAWQHYSRRSFVKFDISQIPVGASIRSASLQMKEHGTFGLPRIIAAHRVTKNWQEGDGRKNSGVTWERYNGVNEWDTEGGDFVTIPTDQELISYNPSLYPRTDEWNVTADVVNFANGTYPNYGWLIKDASEDSSQHYWRFYSREGDVPPQLVVTYGPDEGSIFDANPGTLIVKNADSDVIIDTYVKEVTIGTKTFSIRTLRIKDGEIYTDLTSDKINVTNFVLKNMTRENIPASIQILLTFEFVHPALRPDSPRSISIQTSLAVIKK
ncbi:MAG: DNRLRE domain-containing protein [Patescibacteria group bacterium]